MQRCGIIANNIGGEVAEDSLMPGLSNKTVAVDDESLGIEMLIKCQSNLLRSKIDFGPKT
jgi:hypothetical protein